MDICGFFVSGNDEDISRATDWLMVYKQPPSKVLEYWKVTLKSRMSFIHTSPDPLDKDKRVMLSEILQKWPRYADQDGHILVRTIELKFHCYVAVLICLKYFFSRQEWV